MTPPLPLDHLLYGTADVDSTVADLEERFGTSFRTGGRHPGWGTRNAVLPLGGNTYLEVIGPDEAQKDVDGGPILGVERLTEPRLIWWAVRPSHLRSAVSVFTSAGFRTGAVIDGARTRPDGTRLTWSLTDPRVVELDGVLPMLIDWGSSPHPGAEASPVRMVGLELLHPDGGRLSPLVRDLGLPSVSVDARPGLRATFVTPNGTVVLR